MKMRPVGAELFSRGRADGSRQRRRQSWRS